MNVVLSSSELAALEALYALAFAGKPKLKGREAEIVQDFAKQALDKLRRQR